MQFKGSICCNSVGFRYYLYAIGVPLLLSLAGLAIAFLIGSQSMLNMDIKPLGFFVTAFLSFIIFGGLEEFGWRGIFQHEMKGKMNKPAYYGNSCYGMISFSADYCSDCKKCYIEDAYRKR